MGPINDTPSPGPFLGPKGFQAECPECGEMTPLVDLPHKGSLRCAGCWGTMRGLSALPRRWARERKIKLRARQYEITLNIHDQILQAQGGGCALCGAKYSHSLPGGGKAALAIDHDHVTGAVRGLLCQRCNHALERLDAVPGWAARAQAYLDAGRDYRI